MAQDVIYLENRLVAMLDVLGLSQRLNSREGIETTSKIYNSLILEAKQQIFSSGTMLGSVEPKISNFEVGEFVFDNLVLVSHPISPTTCSQFTLALIRLMQRFALEGMPLRGAVGIGDYCVDSDTKVFLSNVFKALHYEESRQNWSGCVVLENVENRVIDDVCGPDAASYQTKSSAFLRMSVPSKDGMGERWCLNWLYGLSPLERNKVFQFLAADNSKLSGTQRFLEKLESLPERVSPLGPEFLPAVAIKAVLTRGAAEINFIDQQGEKVEPAVKDFTLTFLEH